VLVNYSCDWRPSVYISISAAIFAGAVVFTTFCLYFIRPKLTEVLEARQLQQLRKKSGEGARKLPATKLVGAVQYHSLNTQESKESFTSGSPVTESPLKDVISSSSSVSLLPSSSMQSAPSSIQYGSPSLEYNVFDVTSRSASSEPV